MSDNPLMSRATAISVALALGAAIVLAAGWYRLRLSSEISPKEVHRPAERAAALARIAEAIVPFDQAGTGAAACQELANVKAAVDARLASLAEDLPSRPAVVNRRYVLDSSKWVALEPDACKARAKDVDAEVKRSFALLRAAESWRENAHNKSEALWRGRYWMARLTDIETRNGWAILSGCVRDRTGESMGGVCEEEPAQGLSQRVGDLLLAEGLIYRINDVAQSPSGRRTGFHGKQVLQGQDIVLGFDAELQARANGLVRCFTGETLACADVLPPHLRGDWHYQPGKLRAGVAAMVIVDVQTGLVVAAAGAVSNCTLNNLARQVEKVREGKHVRTPLFRPGTDELCPQIPDSRGAQGFLTVHPIFWLVGPGSTMKAKSMLAGIDSGVIPSSMDSIYRVMLAQSHDPGGHTQLLPQKIARQSATTYMALLDGLGFNGYRRQDVLLGGAHDDAQAWRLPVRGGFTVEPYSIDEKLFSQIAAAKRDHRNADRSFGVKPVEEYLKAYRLSITAVGSGDIRDTAWGLADYARMLALRAEGANSMPPTRIADLVGANPAEIPLDFAHSESVRRLINLLSGATSSRIGGTASGACRVAFGHCPPDGHESVLFSKTGTSETGAGGEASPFIKAAGAGTPPAKVYMAVFRGKDGRLYAAGAMTLRIRSAPGSRRPELSSSSAAELLFLAAAPMIEKE